MPLRDVVAETTQAQKAITFEAEQSIGLLNRNQQQLGVAASISRIISQSNMFVGTVLVATDVSANRQAQ